MGLQLNFLSALITIMKQPLTRQPSLFMLCCWCILEQSLLYITLENWRSWEVYEVKREQSEQKFMRKRTEGSLIESCSRWFSWFPLHIKRWSHLLQKKLDWWLHWYLSCQKIQQSATCCNFVTFQESMKKEKTKQLQSTDNSGKAFSAMFLGVRFSWKCGILCTQRVSGWQINTRW